MEAIEKESLLYGFIDFSILTGSSGPREILKPVVLKSINTLGKNNFTLEELKEAIEKDFGVNLGLLVVKAEVNRFMHQGLLSFDTHSRKYINKADIKHYVEDYKIASEENDYFRKRLGDFINEQTSIYDGLKYAEVFRYFVKYVEMNFDEVITLIGRKEKQPSFGNNKDGIHKFIEEFIYKKVITDDKLYRTFENIFNGIVMLFIYTNCPFLFKEDNPFGEKQMYLDTNIVLRILGLQDTLANEMGKEFIDSISIPHFKICITNETWLEICSLINGYSYEYNKIVLNGNINHIYQIMKNRRIDPNLVGDFINEIKEKLEKLCICIQSIIEVRYEDLKNADDHEQALAKNKYEHKAEIEGNRKPFTHIDQQQYIRQSKHDIKNIYNIKYLRNEQRAKKFEEEKYYFVTADYILRKYTKANMYFGGQPITISDSTLAFLLYYKNKNTGKKMALSSFINAHFNSRRLSIRNWIEYFDVVRMKVEKGEIDHSQAGYLLSQVLLDNDKFENTGVDDIITQSIGEYEKLKDEYLRMHNENQTLERKNATTYDELEKYQEKVLVLETAVKELKTETASIDKENKILKDGLQQEMMSGNRQHKQIMILSMVFAGFGIYLMFKDLELIGSIISIISVFIFIFDVYQKNKKKKQINRDNHH